MTRDTRTRHIQLRHAGTEVPAYVPGVRNSATVAEQLRRIDLCRAARRQQCRGQRNACQRRGDGRIGRGVGGADAEQQRRQRAAGDECAADADRDASGCQQQPFPHDQPRDLPAGGAQGDADAQFPPTFRDPVAEHAVHADYGQQQRDARKQCQQDHRESSLPYRSQERVVKRLDAKYGQCGIDLADDGADGRCSTTGSTSARTSRTPVPRVGACASGA